MRRDLVRRVARRLNPIEVVRRARHLAYLRRQVRRHVENDSRVQAEPRRTTAFPQTAQALRKSPILNQWWYYGAELLPGVVAKGMYPENVPMLPRMHLRHCELEGMECLEMGPMEGIIPVLMKRRGAAAVLAVDAIDGNAERMDALRHYYGVDFEFQAVGLMYELYRKLPGRSFDLINCSGLLYHVYSPMNILAGMRPLLKRNGILIVSTPVINDQTYTMSFNHAGRIQVESNTFWYIAVRLFDYMLRYLQLAPIASLYYPFSILKGEYKWEIDEPAGYLSVVCRAADDVLPAADDRWMRVSAEHSWERLGLTSWDLVAAQPRSTIAWRGATRKDLYHRDTGTLDLYRAINEVPHVTLTDDPSETHVLRLADRF